MSALTEHCPLASYFDASGRRAGFATVSGSVGKAMQALAAEVVAQYNQMGHHGRVLLP